MMDYPQELKTEIGKAERAGGRLLFVEEGKGVTGRHYTAFIDHAATLEVASVMDFDDLPAVTNVVYMTASAMRKALALMEVKDI